MRITVLGIFAAVAMFCSAKNVSGIVTDEGRKPLAFVNVVLMNDSAFIDGNVTDDNGAFLFGNADTSANNVRIKMIGYEETVLPIPADGNLGTVSLTPSAVKLGEVVVQVDAPTTRVKGNAIVTQVENSILATAGSANDVLKNIPMVTGDDGNFSVFGRGNTVIYINGRLVRSANDIAMLSSRDIKEIQVISNPGARYGAEVDAVIRIVTKKPAGEGFSVAASTEERYNKWLTTEEQLDLKYRTGFLEIFGMGYFSYGRNHHSEHAVITNHGNPLLETVSDLSYYSKQTEITGKIGFNYQFNQNHGVGAYYRNDYDNEHDDGDILNVITADSKLSESSFSDYKARLKALPNHSANLYYIGTAGKFTFDFNGDYMQTKNSNRSGHHEQNLLADERNVTTFNTTRNRLFAEKATVSYDLPKGSILIGEEYTDSRSRNDFSNPENILSAELSDVREKNIGLFTEISHTFGQFSVSAGVRYEHVKSDYYKNGLLMQQQSKTYDNLFPSANVTWSPGDFRFSLSYSKRIKRPLYSNLSGNYNYINLIQYTRGNPYLKPERRQDFTAQASWRYITFSAQYTYTKDVITQINEPYEGDEKISVFTVTNTPDQKQFSLFLNAAPKFGIYRPSLSLGMQKQWFEINYRHSNMKFDSPFFTLQMRNTFTLPHDWFVEASLWWRSHGDSKNWIYTHTLSSVDVRVYKMFLDKSLTVYLSANDIFNGMVNHADTYSGNIRMQTNVNNHQRHIRLSVRYNFNTTRSRYKGKGAGQSEKDRL